ncbi:MAG TPA: CHAT domain-containing protein [Caulobacteraceae bacterium]
MILARAAGPGRVGILCLALAVIASGALARLPAPASQPSGASSGALPDPALAYQYNTASWAFASSSDAYRAVARADPKVEGLTRTLEARIFMAYNFANLGREAEAGSALDEAEHSVSDVEQSLPALDQRLLRVDLLIGRSVVQGNIGARASGPVRQTAFDRSAEFAAQAASLAAAPLQGPTSTQQIRDADVIVLGPAKTLAFNLDRGGGLAGAIARPMTADEKLAELRARADFGESAARLALDQTDRAASANQRASEALTRLAPEFASWLRALVDDQKAELELKASDPADAEKTLIKAIATMQSSHGLSRPEAYLWRRLARVQGLLGKTTPQRTSEEKSFNILVAQTDGGPPTRGEVASYQALLAPSAATGNRDDTAKLFVVSSLAIETQTASTIADVAVRLASGNSASAAAIRKFQDARRQLDVATARVSRVHEASPQATQEQIRTAEDDLDQAQAAVVDAALAAQRIAGPRADAVISPKTDLAQVQAALGPDEAYVRFVLLDDGGAYAMVVRKSAARAARLPVNESQLTEAVADLRTPMRAAGDVGVSDRASFVLPAFKLNRAASLYRQLFGGIEPDLAGVSHLVIEPAGPLFALPFGALLVHEPDSALVQRWIVSRGEDYLGAPWLARDKTLELSVGAAAFVRLRNVTPSPATRPLLAFANPVPSPDPVREAIKVGAERETRGLIRVSNPAPTAVRQDSVCAIEARDILGFPALPDTLTEAVAAARATGEDPAAAVVSGPEFTDEAVISRRDLSEYRILLFATHAALPNQEKCWPDPFLITTKAPSATSEGLLEASQLATLNLDANLVVLSACDTAAGDASGQALGGLAQSFFFAGSRGLIVSHWSVDSKATAALISGLFAAIGDRGKAREALAQAERRLMDDPELSHPYYWAAFTLVGGPGGN